MWFDLCKFYIKANVWVFLLEKYYFAFLHIFLIIDISQQYCGIDWTSETFRKPNLSLLKSIFEYIAAIFTMG